MSSWKTKADVVALPSKLSVVDGDGKHLFWADEEQSRELLRDKKVEALRTKRKIRGLRTIVPDCVLNGSIAQLRGRKYSHNREAVDNPQGCWTLIRLPNSTREIFTAVLDQCVNRRKAA